MSYKIKFSTTVGMSPGPFILTSRFSKHFSTSLWWKLTALILKPRGDNKSGHLHLLFCRLYVSIRRTIYYFAIVITNENYLAYEYPNMQLKFRSLVKFCDIFWQIEQISNWEKLTDHFERKTFRRCKPRTVYVIKGT